MSILAKTSSALNTDGASTPADQYDHEISLIDHTRPIEEPLSPQETEAGVATPLSPTSSVDPLRHLWTRDGLQRELKRRKYARYQEDRVAGVPRPPPSRQVTTGVDEEAQGSSSIDAALTSISQSIDEDAPALARKRDTIRHHKNKVTNAVKDTVRGARPKHKHTDAESLFDVLYENQRGAFFCGIPRFSHKSLLNFDPSAWQTHTFHDSPVDITNAQLPDPSWVWADGWNNWYVDMSFGLNEPVGGTGKKGKPAARGRGDTDEEGWRYSFAFGQRGRWAWHGTHPWFHSFVRRRRWVRLRVKRGHALAPEGARVKMKAQNEGHMLNAEYFTIHNAKRPASRYTEGTETSERPEYKRYSAATSKRWSKPEGIHDVEEEAEIRDMPTLLRAIRESAVDREKIAAIRKFLDQGGDELHYLAENMHDIMSLLVFQTSRQQLQSILHRRLRDAEKGDADSKHKEKAQASVDAPSHITNLRNAAAAADEECQRLEYWSSQREGGTKGHGQQTSSSDDCPEGSEEVDAPIGGTTTFTDDVDDGRPDALDLDGSVGTRERESVAAPDRPPEQDVSARGAVERALGGEGKRDSEDEGEDTTPAAEERRGEMSEETQGSGLSSSPEELRRFETASEGSDRDDGGGVEEGTTQKTVVSDFGATTL